MFKTKPPAPHVAEMPKTARVLARPSGVPSIVSAEMNVQGDLQSTGDLQVDGNVTGDIEVAKIVISAGGSVAGNIFAKDVRVCGTMTGTIRAAMVTLTASARVTGDIFHELIAIETGGQLDGQSRRLITEALPAPEPRHEDTNYGNGHDHQPQADYAHEEQHGH